jgi:uncharacterized Tic20 family protein
MTQDNPTPPPQDPIPPIDPNAGAAPIDYGTAPKTGLFAPPVAPLELAPENQRVMGMLAHLLALCGFVGVPFGNFLGPLVIWLIKKEEMPFVDDQGKESLNFQITVLIAAIVISPTICLLGLGIVLLIALAVAAVVLTILASVKASQGVYYRYPWSMRLIK